MSLTSKIYNRLTNNKIDNKKAVKDRKERVREIDKEIHNLKAAETQEKKESLINDMELLKVQRNTQRIKEIPVKRAKVFKRSRVVSEIISSLTSVCGISITFNMINLKYLFSNYWSEYLLQGGALGNIIGLILLGIIFNRGISFTYILLGEDTTLKENFKNYLKNPRYIFISIMVVASITTNFIFWDTLLKNIYIAGLFSITFDFICVFATLLFNKYYYMINIDLNSEEEEKQVLMLEDKQEENHEKNSEKNISEKLNENIIDTSNCNNLTLDFFTEKNDEKEDPKLDPKDAAAGEPNKRKGGRKIDIRTRKKLINLIEKLESNQIITRKSLGFTGNVSILKALCKELAENGSLVYSKVGKDNKQRFYKI